MQRFVGPKAIVVVALMQKDSGSCATTVNRKHKIVRNGQSSLYGSSGVDFGTRSSAGSVFSSQSGAVCDIDNSFIQSIMTESLLPSTVDRSLSVSIAIKPLSRGLAMFRHSVQGA
jgi:hypothetical protein